MQTDKTAHFRGRRFRELANRLPPPRACPRARGPHRSHPKQHTQPSVTSSQALSPRPQSGRKSPQTQICPAPGLTAGRQLAAEACPPACRSRRERQQRRAATAAVPGRLPRLHASRSAAAAGAADADAPRSQSRAVQPPTPPATAATAAAATAAAGRDAMRCS